MTSHDDPLERLTELVRSRRGALIAAARDEGASPQDALECVQDALCTFLHKERIGELPSTPEEQLAAVFTMVRNTARNLRRRHHHLKPHDSGSSLDERADVTPYADELLARAEESIRLRACIAELCSIKRAVVMLRLLEERSGEDVAAALGLERGHVDVLVHRAKAALRVCMREGAIS